MTDTTTDTTVTLSTDDITALRAADTVTFHHGPANTRYVATCIRAHMRGGYSDEPRIWTSREQRLFPTVNGADRDRTIVPAYSTIRAYGTAVRDVAVAFHSQSTYAKEWRTIAKLLRTGDALHVEWVADDNNGNHERVDFHSDSLYLNVLRGEQEMTFLVGTSVGPHNTARMIRPDGL